MSAEDITLRRAAKRYWLRRREYLKQQAINDRALSERLAAMLNKAPAEPAVESAPVVH